MFRFYVDGRLLSQPSEEEEIESKEEKSDKEEESVQPFSGRKRRRGVGGWKDGPARFDRRKL